MPSHEQLPSREAILSFSRQQSIEALKPFAKVGDPIHLDLKDPAVEEALQKVDRWEHETRAEAQTLEENLAVDIETLLIYVEAGFVDIRYLKELYVKIHELLFVYSEETLIPLSQKTKQIVHAAQHTLEGYLEQEGALEETKRELQQRDGIDS